jgi:hypothetical protein
MSFRLALFVASLGNIAEVVRDVCVCVACLAVAYAAIVYTLPA